MRMPKPNFVSKNSFRSWIRKLFERKSSKSHKGDSYRQLSLEHLEDRLAPATLTNTSATTITILLDAATENLTVSQAGASGTIDLATSTAFTNNLTPTTQFAGGVLTPNAGTTTIVIVDQNGSTGSTVTFGGTANTLTQTFNVNLNANTTTSTGNLIFAGGIKRFGADLTANLGSATTTNSITDAAGSTINVTGNLAFTNTKADITLDDSVVNVTGTTNFTAVTGITADNNFNDFTGVVTLNNTGNGNINVDDFDDIVLGAVTLASTVDNVANIFAGQGGLNGGITGSGAINAPGLAASTATVNLVNSGSGDINLSGNITVGFGNLAANAGFLSVTNNAFNGGLTLSGAVVVRGAQANIGSTFLSTDFGIGTITATNAANDFQGPLTVFSQSTGTVTISDSNILTMGGGSRLEGPATLTAATDINSAPGASIDLIDPSGVYTFRSTAGKIDFTTNPIDVNPFFGTGGIGLEVIGTAAANTISITDPNSLRLGAVNAGATGTGVGPITIGVGQAGGFFVSQLTQVTVGVTPPIINTDGPVTINAAPGVAVTTADNVDIILGNANDIAGTVTIAAPAISATANGVVRDLTFRNINTAAALPTFSGGVAFVNTAGGGTSSFTTPIVVTTTNAHGLVFNDLVTISGSTDPNANGTWRVTPLTATTFQLNGSTGTAAGTTVTYTARDLRNVSFTFDNATSATLFTALPSINLGGSLSLASPSGIGQTASTTLRTNQSTFSTNTFSVTGTGSIALANAGNAIGGTTDVPVNGIVAANVADNAATINIVNARLSGAVTGATAAAPIVITATAHGLVPGSRVVISGSDNLAANGVWNIANVTANTFSLIGSNGTGFTAGTTGTWEAGVGLLLGDVTLGKTGTGTGLLTLNASGTISQSGVTDIDSGGAANVTMSLVGRNSGSILLGNANTIAGTVTLAAGAAEAILDLEFRNDSTAATLPTLTNISLTGTTAANITSSTAANPAVVTTAAAHGLVTGDIVIISGVTGAPLVNGTFAVTVLTATTFSIPVDSTGAAGTGGTFVRPDIRELFFQLDKASIAALPAITVGDGVTVIAGDATTESSITGTNAVTAGSFLGGNLTITAEGNLTLSGAITGGNFSTAVQTGDVNLTSVRGNITLGPGAITADRDVNITATNTDNDAGVISISGPVTAGRDVNINAASTGTVTTTGIITTSTGQQIISGDTGVNINNALVGGTGGILIFSLNGSIIVSAAITDLNGLVQILAPNTANDPNPVQVQINAVIQAQGLEVQAGDSLGLGVTRGIISNSAAGVITTRHQGLDLNGLSGININGVINTGITGAITGITNPAAAQVVITSAAHNLATGNQIVISGVTPDNVGVNGLRTVTVIDANTFTIGVLGNGVPADLGTTGTWVASGDAVIETGDTAGNGSVVINNVINANLGSDTLDITARGANQSVSNTTAGKINTGGGAWTITGVGGVGVDGVTLIAPSSGSVITTGTGAGTISTSDGDIDLSGAIAASAIRGNLVISAGGVGKFINSATGIITTGAVNSAATAVTITGNSGVTIGGALNIGISNSISGATNANPTVITTPSTAGLLTGDRVWIGGILGNIGANTIPGNQIATVINATSFSIPVNTTGAAAYVSGGTWQSGANLTITGGTGATNNTGVNINTGITGNGSVTINVSAGAPDSADILVAGAISGRNITANAANTGGSFRNTATLTNTLDMGGRISLTGLAGVIVDAAISAETGTPGGAVSTISTSTGVGNIDLNVAVTTKGSLTITTAGSATANAGNINGSQNVTVAAGSTLSILANSSINLTGAISVTPRSGAVTGATNASPIVISSAAHGLTNGASVTITGVLGNLAANGQFFIRVVDANSFQLFTNAALTVATVGSGAYTSGGTWTATGNLNITAANSAVLPGVITVGGVVNTGFNSGTTTVTMDGVQGVFSATNPLNDFQGVLTLVDISTVGSDFSVVDANTLQFGGASTVKGNLGVTVAGGSATLFAIDEAPGASITTGTGGVTSTATFTVTGSGAKDDIVLSGGNVFSGGALDSLNLSVAGAANNITLNQTGGVVGRLGNISLGNTTSNTGTLLITLNGGGVSQLSTSNGIRTAGPVNLTSVTGVTNDFQLAGAPNIIANTVTFLQTTPSLIRDLQLRNTSTSAAANLRIGITGAIATTSGTNPDQINTTFPHGLVTGDTVTITGVVTDTAANVSTPTAITFVDADSFTIPVAGTAAGTGGAFTSFTGNKVLGAGTARDVTFIFDGGATGTALPVGAGSPFGAATPPTIPAINITGVLVIKAAGGTGFTQATNTVIVTGFGDKNIFETFDGAAINLNSNGTLFNTFPDTIELIQDGAGSNAISLRNSTTTNLGNVLFGTTIRGLPSSTTGTGALTIVSQGGINQFGATAPIVTSGVVLLTIDTAINADFDLSTQPNNLSNAGNKISLTNNADLQDFKFRNIAANANVIDLSALNFGNGSLEDVSIIFNNAALPAALDPGTGLVNVLITGDLDLEVAGAITQGTGTKIQVGGGFGTVNTFRTFGSFGINVGNTGNLFGSSTLNLITGGTGAANITALNASPGAGLTFDDIIFGDLAPGALGSGNLVLTANGSIIQLAGTPPILTSGTGTFNIDQVVGASLILPRANVFGGGITLNLTNGASLGGGDLIIVNGAQSGTINLGTNVVQLFGGTATGGKLDDVILDFLNLGLDAIVGLTTGTGVNAVLPAIDINGNLILRVAGPINTGTSVTKTSLVTGANGPDEFTVRGNFIINVNAAGNLLSQTLVLNNPQGDGTANVAVRSDNPNGINLAASDLGHGTLFVQAGSTSTTANITQSGAITQANGAGLATFQAGNAATNIDLSLANSFSGGVALTGPTSTALNVNFRNVHPLAQVPTVSGLTLSNNDNLTVTLDNAGASLPGLTLNNLTVTALGILQADTTTAGGALVTGGQAIFTANAGGIGFPINLSNPNNNFASTTGNGVQVVTQGPNPVSIQDSSSINFIGASKFGSGDFIVLTNNGDITQNAGSSLVQSLVGEVNFDAGTGKIDLFEAGNTFIGAVTLVGGSTGTSVRIRTGGNLVLGTTIVGDGADFSGQAAGNILQAPGQSFLDSTIPTNTTTLIAGGNITLGNLVNEFSSHLALTAGGDVVIVDSDSSFGGVDLAASTIGGNLTVRTTENKAGNITDSGVVTVGGLATFEAGSGGTIVLDGGVLTAPGNDFSSISLKTTNAAASVKDQSGIVINKIDTGSGALSIVANGAITQLLTPNTGIVSGAATLDAGAGNSVDLDNANNNMVGTISLNSSAGLVHITNLDDITFSATSGFRTTSALELNAGGTLTLPANLNIGSLISNSVFTSVSGNITANGGLGISLTGDVDFPTVAGTTIRGVGGDFVFVGGTITTGGPLTFVGSAVRLDGGTWIQGANNLTIQGGGSLVIGNGVLEADLQLTTADITLTDSDPFTADGSIFVQNNGNFQITGAGGNTVDVFNGTGTINFLDGSIFEVGLGAANDQLLVHGSGNVVITEDGANGGAQLQQNSAISTVAAGAVLQIAGGSSALIVDAVDASLPGHFGNTINNDDVPVSFFSGLDILAPTYAANRTSLSLVQDVSAAVAPGGTSFFVIQGDSDRVNVSAPGVASASPATGLAHVVDRNGQLFVVVRGLTNANSPLTLTVTTTKSAGGDGFADIGGIAINGIGATGRATINATTTNVDGDIFVNGRIAALNIRNMVNGTIESPFQSSSTTTATTISGRGFNNVDIDLLDRLSALTLKSYNGGTITADHFGTIKTTGDAASGNTGDFSNVELINIGTGAAGLSTLSVAGGLNNSLLNISGTIGSVTARSTSNTQIGLDPGPNRLNGGLLGNVTTLNLGTVSSSSVHAEAAGARVNTITSKSWQGGVIHANSIGTITTTGESSSGNPGDFSADLLVRGNNNLNARTALGTLKVAGNLSSDRLDFLNGNVSTITVGRQLGGTAGTTLFLTSTANTSATVQGSGTITTLQAAQLLLANIEGKSITNLRLVGNAAAGMFGDATSSSILLHGSGITGNALNTFSATGGVVSTPIMVENGGIGTFNVTQSLSGSPITIGAGSLTTANVGVWSFSDLIARTITTLNVKGLVQTAPASFLQIGSMTGSSIDTYITSGQTAGGTIGTMTIAGNLDLGGGEFINADEGIKTLTVKRTLSGGVILADEGRITTLTAGNIDAVDLGAETISTLKTTGFTHPNFLDPITGSLFQPGDITSSNIVVNGQGTSTTASPFLLGVGTISVANNIVGSNIDAFQGISNLTVGGILNGASVVSPFGPITTLAAKGIQSSTIFAEALTTLRTTKATSVFDQAGPKFQDGDIVGSTITVTGSGTGSLTGVGIGTLSVAGDFISNTLNVVNRINTFTVTQTVDVNTEAFVGGGITTLTAGHWNSSDLAARFISTFRVNGVAAFGLTGDVENSTFTITGNTGGATNIGLGTFAATGTVSDSIFNITGGRNGVVGGNVTSFTSGRFLDSNLFLGFHAGRANDLFSVAAPTSAFAAAFTLTTFRTSATFNSADVANSASFSGSNVVASRLGTVTLTSIDNRPEAIEGVTFGVGFDTAQGRLIITSVSAAARPVGQQTGTPVNAGSKMFYDVP